MKEKLLLVFLLTAILMTVMVSAANFTVSKTTLELSKTVNSASFEVDNTGGIVNVVVPDFPDINDDGNIIEIATSDSVGDDGIVPVRTKETITVSYTSLPTKLALGTLPNVKSDLTDGTHTETLTLKFVSSFCKGGVKDSYTEDSKTYELDASIRDIELTGFGDEKDNKWYLLDNVEIEFNVDNTGDEDIDDVMIEVCLYDESKGKCIVDEGDMDLDDDFRLKDGDEKKVIVSYQVDPNDIDEAGTYILYVKAYSDDLGEENLCLEDLETIEIVEDEFVLLDNVIIPEIANCGETVEIKADAWNIGDDQQDDVYLIAYNKELGINEKVLIGDIDEWDKEEVSFSFEIPKNAIKKTYLLELRVFDDHDDIFETEDNDEAKFTYSLKVEGNCAEEKTSASITASLESAAVAGEKLAIKGTIKNTGTKETTYSLSVLGYSSWAELDSLDLKTVTLKAGESKDFRIYLNVKEDATGEQFFTINAAHDSGTTEQEVSVMIESAAGAGITGAAITENLKQNWFIWVIVMINVILIIAIIAVARRIATTK